MLLFSSAYPDEPIVGAIVRGCRHFGVPLKVALAGARGVRRNANGTALFALSRLHAFSTLLDTAETVLVANHSVLPFATAYSERKVWERALENLEGRSSGAQALGAVIQSAVAGLPNRRYCTACVKEELDTLGESYWHLSHQLPGCFLCPRHGTVLRASDITIAGNKACYDLPQDCRGRACVGGAMLPDWHEVAVRLKALSRRGLAPPTERSTSYYRELAVARGWLPHGSREVSSQRLAELFEERFGKKALELSGASLGASGVVWPSLMLQEKPGTPFSTLRHTLMEVFLEGAPEDLSHTPLGPRGLRRNRKEDDKVFAEAFKRVAASYATTGRRARIADMLRQAGCWGPYRHLGAAALPRLYRVVQAHQTSSRAYRPQALLTLLVPGGGGAVATRQDLVKTGHLVYAKDAARRLGINWQQMKPMQRQGRILCVPFAHRDWYPAFWFDGRVPVPELELAFKSLEGMSPAERWAAMVRRWEAASSRVPVPTQTDGKVSIDS